MYPTPIDNDGNLFSAADDWQFVDPDCGYLFPWFTLSFLRELHSWDVAHWDVYEAGAGASTVWWARNCGSVYTVDTSSEYLGAISRFAATHVLTNISSQFVPPLGDFQGEYLDSLRNRPGKFDAVVVDASFRDEIAILAEQHLRPGGVIIADNYQQPGVWMARECSKYLNARYEVHVFRQEPMSDPKHHPWARVDGTAAYFDKLREGHPVWQTAYWRIP